MSGVWVFKNGVMRLVENPYNQSGAGESPESSSSGGQQQRMKKKFLVHLPTGEIVSSYRSLDRILVGLGWERYHGGENPDLIQFHKKTSIDLISLPRDFAKFNSIHMYDIVVKNPNIFHVRDV
ncbi:PREDICTED: flowering-promoting factor 1-like protein 1 [Tarenaya hassleriana]|uniref:flowering-promoting factor 1-like protein 1 n=1 Tax=Tarenaya hassleriana TaxID=28532 RepID=UPI00053C6F9B|nr:PREDICTED: flowering-promoting factor 1-like protein 1 [Tarenaya hassleriana]